MLSPPHNRSFVTSPRGCKAVAVRVAEEPPVSAHFGHGFAERDDTPAFECLNKTKENVGRRHRVSERGMAVGGRERHAEARRNRVERVGRILSEHCRGQKDGVEYRMVEPYTRALPPEKGEIERRVMGHEHGVAGEVMECGEGCEG